MKAFVTGATGLLGINLIRALRWEGHHVGALVPQEWHGREFSDDAGIEVVYGCPERPNRWLSALDRSDALFHAAPPTPGVSVLDAEDEWAIASFTTGAMLGPGDIRGSTVGRWVSEFLRTGNIGPAFGGVCIVDARDVALAMMNAAEIRAHGEFTLAGHFVEYVELLATLESLTGRRARLNGRVIARPGAPAGSSRAINELDVTFRPVEETLRDLVAWHAPRRTADLVA